jgi:hypothetical protein
MASQFFGDYFKHKVANAAITDLTPPTFGGITGLTPLGNGALSVNATPGTDALSPIRYEIYISTSNVGLFSLSNICSVVTSFPANVFQNASGSLLTAQLYYVGVRAVDNVGNRETNTAILSATSLGVSSASVLGQLTQINNLIGSPAAGTVSLDLADIKKNTDLIPAAL